MLIGHTVTHKNDGTFVGEVGKPVEQMRAVLGILRILFPR